MEIFLRLFAGLRLSVEEMQRYWEIVGKDFRSFPLLEHMSIWGLTVFVIWFAAVMPNKDYEY